MQAKLIAVTPFGTRDIADVVLNSPAVRSPLAITTTRPGFFDALVLGQATSYMLRVPEQDDLAITVTSLPTEAGATPTYEFTPAG